MRQIKFRAWNKAYKKWVNDVDLELSGDLLIYDRGENLPILQKK